MTDKQIRECFGIASSAPDRVLRNDEEILQSIKNNIGFTKIFDDNRVNDVLQEIRQEIDSHCGDNRDRNDGLYIAMKIIDKYKAESEE